mmetsp:Transcript_31499/g.94251  ORF Transcript_31499/g.94251 Transcript_31499/m.94251 type:complete len:92 (+) Transcript_31499:619-894(+)
MLAARKTYILHLSSNVSVWSFPFLISVVVLERHTNPENGLQWYELTTEARQRLNLPAFNEQARFKVANDLSLLDKDWDESVDDFYLGPGNI